MPDDQVLVIGAGFGGLSAALRLVNAGCSVTVIESAEAPGGKARTLDVGGVGVAGGPTVLTIRSVFDELFAALGERLEDHVTLSKADVIARHFWDRGARLNLFADPERSRDAIGDFAGVAAVKGYDDFRSEAQRIHKVLEMPFMHASKTSAPGLCWRIGLLNMRQLQGIRPWETMWRALGRHFADPRLRQLFGRYATYTGASPFEAPATLMLIAHVEAEGVWLVDGGVQRLAAAMAKLAEARGVRFRYGARCTAISKGSVTLETGEVICADKIVYNGDPSALPALGQPGPVLNTNHRSLSAMVWTGTAAAGSFPLSHHNVFFSPDYRAEFDAIKAGALPSDPTVYVCAQDREASDDSAPPAQDRLQFILNAPANGDRHDYNQRETIICESRIIERFHKCGLNLTIKARQITTPSDFNRRFPGSGGALYGRATHGPFAAFQRPGARTSTPGLYLTGGASHPGAGVPMATLSGLQAASALLADRASIRRSHPVAMPGGISMRSATMGATD
jgi:1-hydroxycarotenoid 3,4-desaturase